MMIPMLRTLSKGRSLMEKDAKIQIRIDSATKAWLKEYATRNNLTISRIFVDFVKWLKTREEKNGS